MPYLPLIHAFVHYSHGRRSVPLILRLCVVEARARPFCSPPAPQPLFLVQFPNGSLCYSATIPTCTYLSSSLRCISATLYPPPSCLPRLCDPAPHRYPPPLGAVHRFLPPLPSCRAQTPFSFVPLFHRVFFFSSSFRLTLRIFPSPSLCFRIIPSLRRFDFPQFHITSLTFYASFPQRLNAGLPTYDDFFFSSFPLPSSCMPSSFYVPCLGTLST